MAKQKQKVVLFSEVQRAVLQSKIMRLSKPEALAWLKTQGHQMGETTYKKTLSQIHKIKDFTILQIASRGLFEQHMERIDRKSVV